MSWWGQKVAYWMFRGGIKGGEEEESHWFGEEKAWENSGIHINILLAWPCLSGHALLQISADCPVFSLNSISNYCPGWGAPCSVCMCVWGSGITGVILWVGGHACLWCQQLERPERTCCLSVYVSVWSLVNTRQTSWWEVPDTGVATSLGQI